MERTWSSGQRWLHKASKLSFNKLNGDGVITDLRETFPQMVNMFSLGRKPKIVRAGIFLQSQLLLYLKDNFPEMLIHQAENATIQNEVMIEHHHAGMQKLMTELLVKFQTIRNESVHLGQKRSDKRIMRNLFELNGDLRKKRNATNMKVPIC